MTRRESPPRVLLGHVAGKEHVWRRRLDRDAYERDGRAPADVRALLGGDQWVREPRRQAVSGAEGCWVAWHGPPAADGRQRWAVFRGVRLDCAEFLFWRWGRAAAEDAARSLSAAGSVS